MDKNKVVRTAKKEFKLTVPVKLGKNDIEQLAMELELTKSSFMTEFIEALLKKAAEIGCKTEVEASNINAVNPFGMMLHSPMEVFGLEAL